MSTKIEENICNAIDLIVAKRIAELEFNRTISAIIKEDKGNGEYVVEFQGAKIMAYSLPGVPANYYKEKDSVYVLILNNKINENRFILSKTK